MDPILPVGFLLHDVNVLVVWSGLSRGVLSLRCKAYQPTMILTGEVNPCRVTESKQAS